MDRTKKFRPLSTIHTRIIQIRPKIQRNTGGARRQYPPRMSTDTITSPYYLPIHQIQPIRYRNLDTFPSLKILVHYSYSYSIIGLGYFLLFFRSAGSRHKIAYKSFEVTGIGRFFLGGLLTAAAAERLARRNRGNTRIHKKEWVSQQYIIILDTVVRRLRTASHQLLFLVSISRLGPF